jgi:pantetheine-phosphate adenylyltransferase
LTTAIYPGTFDPVHNGHIDIATRAAQIFEHVTVAIYARPQKNLLFSTRERREMLEQALAHLSNVSVTTYNQLTVELARRLGARAIVRGLRVFSDFELEFQSALINKKLAEEIEYVCFMTSHEYAFLSASSVKEVAMLGGCITGLVPDHVADALRVKFEELGREGEERVRLVSLRD